MYENLRKKSMKGSKIFCLSLYIFFLAIVCTSYAGYTSRFARLFRTRANKQKKRFYRTAGKPQSRWQHIKNISKKDFATAALGGLTAYGAYELKKYFDEQEDLEQKTTWWDHIKDWWDLRNLTKEEQEAVKEILSMSRPPLPMTHDFWFFHIERIFEKYQYSSSIVVQKKLNDLRYKITNVIHKKIKNIKDFTNLYLRRKIEKISSTERKEWKSILEIMVNSIQREIAIAHKVGAEVKKTDLSIALNLLEKLKAKETKENKE